MEQDQLDNRDQQDLQDPRDLSAAVDLLEHLVCRAILVQQDQLEALD